jgi:hypothetical protein
MFVCAGTIEGFVTGSSLPPLARIAIGVVAWSAYVVYVVHFGRAAARQGFVGDLDETDAALGDQSRPVALTRR